MIKKILNKIKSKVYISFNKNKLPVFWHDCQGVNNFGDQLNPYILKKISDKEIVHIKNIPIYSNKNILVAIGSVISRANENCSVWGSGIISSNTTIKKSKFIAVRGPRTIQKIKDFGFEAPKIMGDPAILLPTFYKSKDNKIYEFGIVPHFEDYSYFKNLKLPSNVLLIDLTNDIEKVIEDITKCKKIASSSLHGLIVANIYKIPASWCVFSNKIFGDNVKYYDYFESFQMTDISPTNITPNDLLQKNNLSELPYFDIDMALLKNMQNQLLKVLTEHLESLG